MDPKKHSGGSTVNIIRGKLAPLSVNVDNVVDIGEAMLEDFERTWLRDSTIPSPRNCDCGSNKQSVQVG